MQFTEQKEKPTALNVRVSLKMLSAKHAESSDAAKEANKMLVAAIKKLNEAVIKAYEGNSVFAVITVEEHHHSRSKRQVTPPPDDVSSAMFDLDDSY